MADATISLKNKRRPLTAIILSLILPGLGHMYCGRLVKGLILAFLTGISVPATIVAFSAQSGTTRILIIVFSWLTATAIGLVAVIDSYYTARHTKPDYQLKDYNRWYVYLLLLMMSTGGSLQIALHVRAEFLEAFIIPTQSMYPTMIPQDRFLATKKVYLDEDPRPGDIVVFKNPDNRRQNYIKRVVATGGDTVELRQGKLIINGQERQQQKLDLEELGAISLFTEGQLCREFNGGSSYNIFLAQTNQPDVLNFGPVTVPVYHCFVLGDNRNLSWDSRTFGAISISSIIGRVDYLYCPAKDWSRFGRIAD